MEEERREGERKWRRKGRGIGKGRREEVEEEGRRLRILPVQGPANCGPRVTFSHHLFLSIKS
jgi:hypothetical protein